LSISAGDEEEDHEEEEAGYEADADAVCAKVSHLGYKIVEGYAYRS